MAVLACGPPQQRRASTRCGVSPGEDVLKPGTPLRVGDRPCGGIADEGRAVLGGIDALRVFCRLYLACFLFNAFVKNLSLAEVE